MKKKYKYAIYCEMAAIGYLALGCIQYILFKSYSVNSEYLLVIGILFFGTISIFGTIPCAYFGFEGEKV